MINISKRKTPHEQKAPGHNGDADHHNGSHINKKETLVSHVTQDSKTSQNKNEKKDYNSQRSITMRLFELIRNSEIGGDKLYLGPYGQKRSNMIRLLFFPYTFFLCIDLNIDIYTTDKAKQIDFLRQKKL